MCNECENDSAVLPSLESFQMRLKMPKVNYIFYQYFFKAVVNVGAWKHQFTKGRFGTNVLEAFAHAILQNNYFAWLYHYKLDNPDSTLKMEFDLADEKDSTDDNDNSNKTHLFSGDLDFLVEIALLDDNDSNNDSAIAGEYTLVFNGDSTTAAYKAAKEAAEKVREESLASINNCRLQSYSQVNLLSRISSQGPLARTYTKVNFYSLLYIK